MVSRRVIQSVLGVFWLIDGLLQLKPQMFTTAFISQVVQPTAQSQPAIIAHLVNFGANLASTNTAFWDALFAAVQIAIGFALIFHVRSRLSLTASIIWAILVWVFGEGLGQIFTGQALLLTGAPGAVFLYGLIAIAIWPGHETPTVSGDWRPDRIAFARISLGLIWMFGCILHFQNAYAAGEGISSLISTRWLAHFVAAHADASGLLLGILEFGLASMFLLNVYMRFTTLASIVISFVFWWVGQSFGQLFTPFATDLNSGPLLILLALTVCPWLIGGLSEVKGHTENPKTGGHHGSQQSNFFMKS